MITDRVDRKSGGSAKKQPIGFGGDLFTYFDFFHTQALSSGALCLLALIASIHAGQHTSLFSSRQ